jgi:hypothetical protein
MKPPKIDEVSIIINGINYIPEDNNNKPIHIGNLNKAQGIKGFKIADIGNPVFETKDRYLIILESLDGNKSLDVFYLKKDLYNVIDFLK